MVVFRRWIKVFLQVRRFLGFGQSYEVGCGSHLGQFHPDEVDPRSTLWSAVVPGVNHEFLYPVCFASAVITHSVDSVYHPLVGFVESSRLQDLSDPLDLPHLPDPLDP